MVVNFHSQDPNEENFELKSGRSVLEERKEQLQCIGVLKECYQRLRLWYEKQLILSEAPRRKEFQPTECSPEEDAEESQPVKSETSSSRVRSLEKESEGGVDQEENGTAEGSSPLERSRLINWTLTSENFVFG